MQHLPKNYRESKRGSASFPPLGWLWVGFGKCCIHAINNSSILVEFLEKVFSFVFLKIKETLMFLIPLEIYPDSPDFFRCYRRFLLSPYVKRVKGGFLYKNKVYPDYLHMGGACCAIFQTARKYCNGKGVDIGAGYWQFPQAIPVDIGRGEGLNNRIEDFDDNSLDYVFSSHCLEHILEWEKALELWCSKIKNSGILFLYLPHSDCEIWHPGSPFVNTGHKWIPDFEVIRDYLEKNNFKILCASEKPDVMYSFYICAEKICDN